MMPGKSIELHPYEWREWMSGLIRSVVSRAINNFQRFPFHIWYHRCRLRVLKIFTMIVKHIKCNRDPHLTDLALAVPSFKRSPVQLSPFPKVSSLTAC